MLQINRSFGIEGHKENPERTLKSIFVGSCLFFFLLALVTGILAYAKAASAATCAYIYNTDVTTADDFVTFLESKGHPTTKITMSAVGGTNFSGYDLIIVGSDSGNLSAWGDNSSGSQVNNSGKPIIGLGEGGYAFFGRISLAIGFPNGAHTSTPDSPLISVVDPTQVIFNSPIVINTQSPLQLYTSTAHVEIYAPSPPQDVTLLGNLVGYPGYSPLIKEGSRYILWGFTAGPSKMTEDGKDLFSNIIVNMSGLVAYYPFSGNANDASGNGNNGIVGTDPLAPLLTQDRFGAANNAYVFDGVDDYIHVPVSGSLNITGGITLAAWIYPYEQKTQEILCKGPQVLTPYGLSLSDTGDVIFTLTLAGDTLSPTQVRKIGYDLNRWIFVAGTYDGASMKLYVDGVPANTQLEARSMTQNASELLIGTRLNLPADTFNGKLDEIRIYNRALTSDEILQLSSDLTISSINPSYASNSPANNNVPLSLAGTGFQPGATVQLTNFVLLPSGQTSIDATNVNFVSSTEITPTFNLVEAVIGHYDVVVTNPDGQSATLPKGFAVLGTDPPVTTAFPVGGIYNAALKVTLKANELATIHYTTDGTVPTANSPVYSAPIDILPISGQTITTATLKFFSIDAAGNQEDYTKPQNTQVYTIDTTYQGTAVLVPPTNEMVMPVTSTFTFPAGTQTFPVDCQKVNHTLTDSFGNLLPITDYLKVYVIPDDIKTYSGPVSVTCDLAQLYPLVPGNYTLEVTYSNYFQPKPEDILGVTLFKGSISAEPIPVTVPAINTHIITTSVGSEGGNIYLAGSIVSGPVSVRDGTSPTFTITPDTGYLVADVLVDGSSVGAVTSYSFNSVTLNHTIVATFYNTTKKFDYHGFLAPMDNPPVLNKAKAGQAIPVKWQLKDENGGVIANPSSVVSLISYQVNCAAFSGEQSDAIPSVATAGSSGLQYLGDGNWQYNWKTLTGYAGKCMTLVLTLSDGATHTANFQFTK